MEKARKILSITTIVSAVIISGLLILLLFGVNFLGDYASSVYFTFGSLAVGGFFAINSLNMIMKNKVLGWISFSLIAGSVLLIILSSWLNFDNKIYANIMISLGLLSVLFNIIVASGLDLGKSYLAIQIPVYIVAGIADLITSLIIFSALDLSKMFALFLAVIIVTIVGIVVLKVLAKKNVSGNIQNDKDMIKISRKQYDLLVEKAKKYDQLMAKNQTEGKKVDLN